MLQAASVSAEARSKSITVLITPTMNAELEAIMAEDHRSMSWVCAALLERGLGLYRNDQMLKTDKSGDRKLDLMRGAAKAEAPRKRRGEG